mmetsp:Transcript_107513/g.314333  ORF Transcript_107513/g.314333 Transcript_107513/m.314333 type:complete len:296 (+) Transcript_107513:1187-2074(+)
MIVMPPSRGGQVYPNAAFREIRIWRSPDLSSSFTKVAPRKHDCARRGQEDVRDVGVHEAFEAEVCAGPIDVDDAPVLAEHDQLAPALQLGHRLCLEHRRGVCAEQPLRPLWQAQLLLDVVGAVEEGLDARERMAPGVPPRSRRLVPGTEVDGQEATCGAARLPLGRLPGERPRQPQLLLRRQQPPPERRRGLEERGPEPGVEVGAVAQPQRFCAGLEPRVREERTDLAVVHRDEDHAAGVVNKPGQVLLEGQAVVNVGALTGGTYCTAAQAPIHKVPSILTPARLQRQTQRQRRI